MEHREPSTIPAPAREGLPEPKSPKYVYNFLFQKGSFLFKLGPETFQGAERGLGQSQASLCAGTLHWVRDPCLHPAPQPCLPSTGKATSCSPAASLTRRCLCCGGNRRCH